MAAQWILNGVPRWVTLIDEALFVVASILFLYGSYGFVPGSSIDQYVDGCELFILGSFLLFGLAVFGLYEVFEDARLSHSSPSTTDLVEQALYLVGSLLFVVGTILFTPALPEDDASLKAIFGSFGFLPAATPAATHAAASAGSGWHSQLLALFSFKSGHVSASELLAPQESSLLLGDQLFVLGSALFSIAAFVSALRTSGEFGNDPTTVLKRRVSVATASLYELGGVAFVVGTLGFIPAGPLGITACPSGAETLGRAGATLFICGSTLYTAGSLLTLWCVATLTYGDGWLSAQVEALEAREARARRDEAIKLEEELDEELEEGASDSGGGVEAPELDISKGWEQLSCGVGGTRRAAAEREAGADKGTGEGVGP